jgi:hypothetical protein
VAMEEAAASGKTTRASAASVMDAGVADVSSSRVRASAARAGAYLAISPAPAVLFYAAGLLIRRHSVCSAASRPLWLIFFLFAPACCPSVAWPLRHRNPQRRLRWIVACFFSPTGIASHRARPSASPLPASPPSGIIVAPAAGWR